MRKCLGMYCGKGHEEVPEHLCPYAQEELGEPEKSQECTCCPYCTQLCQDDI